MAKSSGVNTVLLLDNYNEDSKMLHKAFKASNYQGKVVVIEDDGFLPEDVISLYRYFCGPFKGKKGIPGKPRYFNQIDLPDYWEIEATNQSGKVMNLYQQRGTIFYTTPTHKRLVSVVDWKDEHGFVRSSDHYDCYGALYARTTFNKKGERFCKTYYDADGKEIIVENYVTHDIILNRENKVYIYKSKVALIQKLFEVANIQYDSIFYNSLSTPFFVSESLQSDIKADVLFWQENPRNDIPGNMQVILNGNSSRTSQIYVQKKQSYENLIRLGASPEIVKPLGFVYNYEKENTCGNEILICTNSDQIESVTQLVEALPEMKFHIAAITEMSSKLLSMSQYDNVSLYPGVKTKVLDELFMKCDMYLDINYGNEIVSAVKRAFLHNQVILGFKHTLHNTSYIAQEHIFSDANSMIECIQKIKGNKDELKNALYLQKEFAMAENTEDYQNIF